MSVVGLDLGFQNCYISVARQGGIEVATNDYSLRDTPACVQFGAKNRVMGVAAKQQIMGNLKNTVEGIKHLIGRKYSDPFTQHLLNNANFNHVPLPGDYIGIKVEFKGEARVFTPEQILSILLLKLKESSEIFLKSKVSDCVVSVPCFWTDAQRRALIDATKIADLNCLRILNETTAVALAYGIYKQDLPTEKEKSRNVVFVDVGASATQACIVAFNKGKLKVLGTSWDMGLGGRAFDQLIRDRFNQDFKDRYRLDASTKPRPWLRLLSESEKVKKLMSANSQAIPLNIECFMEDKDVTGKMTRSEMEELCAPFWPRLTSLLQRLLSETKIKLADVDSVELLGGSTRIPRVKQLVQEVFGMEPKTTLNQDEAVSRGCALQCAMLSPTFRVREFSVSDSQPFAIKLSWNADKTEDGEMVVFEENHPFPYSKMLTFYRREPFALNASYNLPNHIPYPDTNIGKFVVKNVGPTAEEENSKVKVKVRINPNGLFTVSSAFMYEKQITAEEELQQETQEEPQQQPMDMQNEPPTPQEAEVVENGGEAAEKAGTEGGTEKEKEGEAGGEKEKEKKSPPKPVKPKIKSIDLPIEEMVPQMSQTDLDKFRGMEAEMQKSDRVESEKAEARNALEEYVYEIRDKLSSQFEPFINDKDSAFFSKRLQETEDWIYEDGDDQPKQVYLDKHDALKKLGDPVAERYQEFLLRPQAFEEMGQSLQRARKFYEQYLAGEEKYNHLDAKDMERVRKGLEEKQSWFDSQINAQNRRPTTETPIVFATQIRAEREALDRIVGPVMTKPKPKVEPPPEEKKPDVPPPPPQQPPPNTANGDLNGEGTMEVD